jgi:hypothetical protein
VDEVVKWGKTEVEAAEMLKDAVVDREEDMSPTKKERDTVVEGFSVCHKGLIV